MRYLFQHRVTSDRFSCDSPLQLNIEGAIFKLFLKNIKILTDSKKLHIIAEGDNADQAYQNIFQNLADFQNRLIFFTGKKILINELELVLLSQANHEIRDVFIQGVDLNDFAVDAYYFDGIESFLNNNKFTDVEALAINHYILALINDTYPDKFRNLYLVIEDLLKKDKKKAGCDKCGANLICPNGHGTKTYPTILKKDIIRFIDKINNKETSKFPKLSGESVFKMRQKLFHSQQKKGGIDKAELEEMIHSLSLCILEYFEDKFYVHTMGGSAIEYSVGTRCWYQFNAINVIAEFDWANVPLTQGSGDIALNDDFWINTDQSSK